MGCCGPSPLEKLSCPHSSSSSYPRYAIHNAGPVPIPQVLSCPQSSSSSYPRYAIHNAGPVPIPQVLSCPQRSSSSYPRYAIHNAGPVPIPQVLSFPKSWSYHSKLAVLLSQLSSGLVQLPTELVQFLSHVLSYSQTWSSS
jgi:hypothetical protein